MTRVFVLSVLAAMTAAYAVSSQPLRPPMPPALPMPPSLQHSAVVDVGPAGVSVVQNLQVPTSGAHQLILPAGITYLRIIGDEFASIDPDGRLWGAAGRSVQLRFLLGPEHYQSLVTVPLVQLDAMPVQVLELRLRPDAGGNAVRFEVHEAGEPEADGLWRISNPAGIRVPYLIGVGPDQVQFDEMFFGC